jgi:hypothetical protein
VVRARTAGSFLVLLFRIKKVSAEYATFLKRLQMEAKSRVPMDAPVPWDACDTYLLQNWFSTTPRKSLKYILNFIDNLEDGFESKRNRG